MPKKKKARKMPPEVLAAFQAKAKSKKETKDEREHHQSETRAATKEKHVKVTEHVRAKPRHERAKGPLAPAAERGRRDQPPVRVLGALVRQQVGHQGRSILNTYQDGSRVRPQTARAR